MTLIPAGSRNVSLNNISVPKFRNNETSPSDRSTFNDSFAYHLPGLVTFASYAGTLILALSVCFDCLIVATFFRHRRRLITPFTVQFLNFVLLQLLLMLYDGPLNVMSHLDRDALLDPVFCGFFKFGAWTFPSLALLQQMAIGMDRWSALLVPVWYRTKTIRYGVRVTVVLVVFYFALYLPLFIADTMAGVAAGQRCDLHHTLGYYQVVVRVATYYIPLCFTYVSYPLLLLALRNRRTSQIQDAVIKASKCDHSLFGILEKRKCGEHK